jgi:DNA processing protein
MYLVEHMAVMRLTGWREDARGWPSARPAPIREITRGDAEYPAHLREIPAPPERLWVRGSLVDDDALAIAIVGSRRATPFGLELAEQLAGDLAVRGITVVSGLARGIDSAAHRGALEAGGRTIAVLGCGVDSVYPPENRRLAARITERGALLSQFAPGARALAHHFPVRNRIIAGLALGVVVVEAAAQSGTLITAGHAGDLGREVMAVPGRAGSPTSRGTHQLIRDGAALVEAWDDVVELLPARWRACVASPAIV